MLTVGSSSRAAAEHLDGSARAFFLQTAPSMSARSRKRAQAVEHEADKRPGSGQITEVLQGDIAAQPALLAAGAKRLQQRAADAPSAPATPKPSKKKAKATLAQLIDAMPTSPDLQTRSYVTF